MRRLLPEPAGLHLDELYDGLVLPAAPRDADGAARAWVALGVVASVDGSATLTGRSGPLGGEADRTAFRRLRDACDAILVGAGTVRTEGYRPPTGDAQRRASRVDRGLVAVPRLVIVSASLQLQPDAAAFADAGNRPLIVTHREADAARVQELERVAEVVRVGDRHVDLAELVTLLPTLGLGRVLCEGGPRLAGSLLASDHLDELFVTVAPTMVGGTGPRIVHGDVEVPRQLSIVSIHEHDGELLLRYRRTDGGR